MEPFPPTTIETSRLLLRPMVTRDLAGLLGIFADPKVMASFSEEPFTPEQMRRWLDRNLRHQEEFGYGLFSVIRKTDGLLIGDCGLEQMTVEGRRVAELGYDFRSDVWNQGYATEAARAVRDYAFDVLELSELISLVRQANLASARVAEKVGMRRAAELERYGARYWQYQLTKEELQASSR
ncbi:MAG: GNAT family N-acetyltransferase [Anaerolineae bacterium]|jgi:RimJ/RimL family protein N-acetyltransferase|nr:GNAT family N-acetyltransferase [Anaerolineae bacterium]